MVKCHSAAAASGARRLWSVYGAECRHGGLEQALGASPHLPAERVWRKGVAFRNKQKVIGWALSNTFKWDQLSFLLLLVRRRRKLIGLKTFHAVSLTRWMCPISEMKSEQQILSPCGFEVIFDTMAIFTIALFWCVSSLLYAAGTCEGKT